MEKMIKWLQNFWYHYKFRTILCLFFVAILAFSIAECAANEKYDMQIYLYLSDDLSSDVERAFDQTFEEYLNDGKKTDEQENIGIIDLSYDPYNADGDYKTSSASALTGEFILQNNFIIVTDEYRLEELTEKKMFDGILQKRDDFDAFDGVAYSINGTEFEKRLKNNLEKNGIKNISDLYISLLIPPDKEKEKEKYNSYQSAVELIEKITAEKDK